MKKTFLFAALLFGASFVNKADAAPAMKPKILVHVVGCGVDTYLYGANQAEINEGIQAIKDAYCWS